MPKRSANPSDDPALGSFDPAHHPPMAFSDGDWGWFVARCSAMGVEDAGSRRTTLEALYGHLVGVNRWLNLTTITDPRGFLKLHVLDSLTLLGEPRLNSLKERSPCLDLGSGGGYPGLPLALWRPHVPWVLADARQKKAEFLSAAAGIAHRLGGVAAITARHLRGGETARLAPDLRGRCQLVVSRAMGQCDEVLSEASPLLGNHGHCIVYKGPAFAGKERERTLLYAEELGYRFVDDRRVSLDEGDPERVMVVFERLY